MDKPLRPDGDGGRRPDGGLRPDDGGRRPDGGFRPDDGGRQPDNRPRPDDPLRPDDRPRPDDRLRPGDRPSFDNRGDRIGNRTDVANRPDFSDRNRWSNNQVINNRPQWANIDNSTNIDINNRWNNAFTNANNRGWWNESADRAGYWNGWADGVRSDWGNYHRHDDWFGNDWWDTHHCDLGGWHYHYSYHDNGWNYWWTAPAWNSLSAWFIWSAPQQVWSQPVYYDYGAGGNVTYEGDNVYVGGEQVATADAFAQSAMDLATVAPPESEEQAAQTEWMPLGTFAVSMSEKDTQPSQTVQLAVSREGIISGTLYNIDTDQAYAVQGQVDKETQRVALRIG